MILLDSADIAEVFHMQAAMEVSRAAFVASSARKVEMPLRSRLSPLSHNGVTLIMPSCLRKKSAEILSVKVISTFPNSGSENSSITNGAILLLEPDTGIPLALMEGSTVTSIRTGAASGVAADLLAKSSCKVAALLGAGSQGSYQVEAVIIARPVEHVWIYDPILSKAERLVSRLKKTRRLGHVRFDVAASARQAVADADIICASTDSTDPVFRNEDLKGGVHINGIGSYTASMREIPGETVCSALVIVDSLQAALAEAGDIIGPIQEGLMTADHVYGEIGEIIDGVKPGRSSDDQVTFFKSVGIAAQDAMAADYIYTEALKRGLGQHFDWQ